MAGGRGRVLRRRRRVPHGVPLPAHAAAVHGAAHGGPLPDRRHPPPDADAARTAASGRCSCATTTSSRSRWSPTKSATTCTAPYAHDPVDAHQPRHPAPARAAAAEPPPQDRAHARAAVLAAGHARPLLRRRDRHGRQRLPRRPRRGAHTDAVERRSQRRLLRRESAAALPAGDHRSGVQLRDASTSRRSSTTRTRCCGGCGGSSRCAGATPCSRTASIELLAPDNHRVLAFLRAARGRQQVLVVGEPLALRAVRRARPARVPRLRTRSSCSARPSFPAIGDLPYLLTLGPARVLLARARTGARSPTRTAPRSRRCTVTERVDGAALARPSGHHSTASCPSSSRPSAGSGRRAARSPARGSSTRSRCRCRTTGRTTRTCRRPNRRAWRSCESSTPTASPRPTRSRSRSSPAAPASAWYDENHAGRARPRRLGVGPTGCGHGRALAARLRARAGALHATAAARRAASSARSWACRSVRSSPGSPTSTRCPSPCSAASSRTPRCSSTIASSSRPSGGSSRGSAPRSSSGARSPGRTSSTRPPLLGSIEYRMVDGTTATVAVLHDYVKNESDAYSWYRDALGRFFDGVAQSSRRRRRSRTPRPNRHPLELLDSEPPVDFELLAGDILPSVELLGRRTADLHVALASVPDDGAFTPEPLNLLVQRSTYQSMRNTAVRTLRTLRARASAGSRRVRGRGAVRRRTTPTSCSTGCGRCSARPAGRGSACTATSISARCCRPDATSCSSTSRASPRCRSASAGSSARRCATSRACCGRSTTRPRTSIPDAVARGQVRSEERAQELLAHRS